MILTLTANTTLDQTVFISAFKKNTTMRATRSVLSMGGKPACASFVLGTLGYPSTALGFAAGTIGQAVAHMLQGRGATAHFTEVNGQSRLNVVIIDEADHTSSTITTSTLEVTPDHVRALLDLYRAQLATARVVVTGGTLPTGLAPAFYADVIGLATAQHVPVIFDASEPNLSAGLAARPAYVKPNRHELSALVGFPIDSLDAAYVGGREILERYGTTPIITLDSDGGLAVLPDRAYRIPPIPVEVASPAGAGDAVLAGLAAAVSQGKPIEDGLLLGFAAATAVCLMPGTADCRREDVETFLPRVELIPYL
jgi:1-phosphofructokinase family hexose kinase